MESSYRPAAASLRPLPTRQVLALDGSACRAQLCLSPPGWSARRPRWRASTCPKHRSTTVITVNTVNTVNSGRYPQPPSCAVRGQRPPRSASQAHGEGSRR